MIPKIGQTTANPLLLGHRDAFHCPAILVTCEAEVWAGMSLRFIDAACSKVAPSNAEGRAAFVDPFLGVSVKGIQPGRLFWAFVLPEFVSGMHHQFDIPSPAKGAKAEDDPLADYMEVNMGISQPLMGTGTQRDFYNSSSCGDNK